LQLIRHDAPLVLLWYQLSRFASSAGAACVLLSGNADIDKTGRLCAAAADNEAVVGLTADSITSADAGLPHRLRGAG